jgi:two-component system sensor kinase FixL
MSNVSAVANSLGLKHISADEEVEQFRRARGPFVTAAEVTRMAMIFTSASTSDHPVIFANNAFQAMTGLRYRDLVGKPFDTLLASQEACALRLQVETEFGGAQVTTIELEIRRKGMLPLLVAARINPVFHEDGEVVQHCISFVDLGTHIDRVQKERNALHTLFQNTPDFIAMMVGHDHRFSFANEAFKSMANGRVLVGRPVAEAMPELAPQGIVALLDRVFATGTALEGDGMAVELYAGHDGVLDTRFLNFICQAMRDTSGTIIGIFCEGHDATEQSRADAEVSRLQSENIHLAQVNAMSTMAATLAHELSQPLTAISNYTEACGRLAGSLESAPPALVAALNGIRDGATRAQGIIRRMKDMTRPARSEREAFDIEDAVAKAIELVNVGTCSAVSVAYCSDGPMIVAGDRLQIEQVIANLLRNACEATVGRVGGVVSITTASTEDRLTVKIADNGPGVSPPARATLFDWSESTKPNGSGIGLSICRTIMAAHGGDIWLDRSDEDGSRFGFSLPIKTVAV